MPIIVPNACIDLIPVGIRLHNLVDQLIGDRSLFDVRVYCCLKFNRRHDPAAGAYSFD